MKIFSEGSVRSIVEIIKPRKIVAIGVETGDANHILNFCKHNLCKLVLINSSVHISTMRLDDDTNKSLTLISDTNLDELDDFKDLNVIFINCAYVGNGIFKLLKTLKDKASDEFPIMVLYNYKDPSLHGFTNKKIVEELETVPLKIEEILNNTNFDLIFTEIPVLNGLFIIYPTTILDNYPGINEVFEDYIRLNDLKGNETAEKNLKINLNPDSKKSERNNLRKNNIPISIGQMPYIYMFLKSNNGINSLLNNIKGYRAIKRLNLFDYEYYLNKYSEVSNSGLDPLLHYLYIGYKEGKNPNPYFDGKRYLSQYQDVKMADINPLIHYALWGTNENRKSELVINVIVISNNNEEHITKCLDAILNQTGNFKLGIIIGDVSNDKSREIIKEYHKKYQDIIQVVPHEDKLGKYQNLMQCFKFVTGEYVAICDADSQWLDPFKLEKMSNFLDQNQDCAMIFHPTLFCNHGQKEQYPPEDFPENKYSKKDLANENFIGNISSCFYRTNTIKTIPSVIFDGIMDGWIFNLLCSEQGNIGYIKDSITLSATEEKPDLKTAFNLKHGFFDHDEIYSKEITPSSRMESNIKERNIDHPIYEIIKTIFITNPLKKTLKGKNKTLFLINDSSHELRQHFDVFYQNIFNPKVFKKYYNNKLKFCNKRKIKYQFFIVPDKSLVCKDQLPFEVGLVKRNYDSIKNLVPDFIEYLDETSYFKNDSHINYHGAKTLIYHYIKTMDQNFTENDLDNLINEQITTINLVKNGDLLTELNWSYSNEEKEDYLHDKTSIYKNENLKDLNNSLPEEFKYNGKRITYYWENTHKKTGLKLMVLRDSSMNILYDLMSTNYKEIMLCWDHWHFNQELVEWYKPDIILEIRTERFLEQMERFV